MLNHRPSHRATRHLPRSASGRKQQGVVLFITLIILVAMTLAGMAMVRSVFTTNLIAGNLALQQAATNAGDAGTESAIAWLEANSTGTNLHNSIYASGYAALRQDPVVGQSWDQFWNTVLKPAGQIVDLPADAADNQVSYTIQRLCNALGDPTTGIDCAQPQTNSSITSGSKGAGAIALQYNGQVYYRITSRITGPRNTVSYVQTIVSL